MMTPAVKAIQKAKLAYTIHTYHHDPSCKSYGTEAVTQLQVAPDRVFKTLVVSLDGNNLAVGIVPVVSRLSLKRMAKATEAKKAVMANPTILERSTGYVPGAVSPLGQKKKLTTVIDSTAKDFATIFVSAGRRGIQLEMRPGDLQILTNGKFSDICRTV